MKNNTTKTEPHATIVRPAEVSRMGTVVVPETKTQNMFAGPVLQAPMAKETIHERGSQGEHK